MPEVPKITPTQMRVSVNWFKQYYDQYDSAVRKYGKENADTDVRRAHISGAKWIVSALFGRQALFDVEREFNKATGKNLPHPGPRIDEHGRLQ